MNPEDIKIAKQLARGMRMLPKSRFRQIFLNDIQGEIQEKIRKEKMTQEQAADYYLSEPTFKQILSYADVSTGEFIEMCNENNFPKLTFWQRIRDMLPF
jgi:hypothetical protein